MISDALAGYIGEAYSRIPDSQKRIWYGSDFENAIDIKPFQPPLGSPQGPDKPFISVDVRNPVAIHAPVGAADALSKIEWDMILNAKNVTSTRTKTESLAAHLTTVMMSLWYKHKGSTITIRGCSFRSRQYGRRRERGDLWQAILRLESEVYGAY